MFLSSVDVFGLAARCDRGSELGTWPIEQRELFHDGGFERQPDCMLKLPRYKTQLAGSALLAVISGVQSDWPN